MTRLGGALICALVALSCEPEPKPATVDAGAVEDRSVAALPELRVATARLTRIELSGPHGGKKQRPIVLGKTKEGWQIVSPVSYRANPSAVGLMVAVLAEIEVLRAVPSGEVSTGDAWVGAKRGLEVKAWAGDRTASHFVVGRSSREQTYVRAAAGKRVFAAVGRIRPIFDKSLAELRDRAITKVPLAQITRVRYDNRHGTLEFTADPEAPGEFVPVGPKIPNFHRQRAGQQIRLLAGLIARGFVDDPAKAEQTGLFQSDAPRARLFVKGEGGEHTVDVWVGKRTPPKRLYLRTSLGKQIYLVSAHLESSLLARRSHFERSAAELKPASQSAGKQPDSHEGDAGKHDHDHDHGGSGGSPEQLPENMLAALRGMARDQQKP